jgi:hypothetical protein
VLTHASLRFGIELTSQPLTDVLIRIDLAFNPELQWMQNMSKASTIFPYSVTFTSSDWSNRRPVTVMITNDQVARSDYSMVVSIFREKCFYFASLSDGLMCLCSSSQMNFNATSNVTSHHDRTYNELTHTPKAVVPVTDENRAGLLFSQSKLLIGCTPSGTVLFGSEYSLKLSSRPTRSVTVNMEVIDSLSGLISYETRLSLYRIVFGKNDWHIPRVVLVNATMPLDNLKPVANLFLVA